MTFYAELEFQVRDNLVLANGTRPGHLACYSVAATIRCAPFTICLHSPQRLPLSPPPPGLSSGLDV